MPKRIIKALVGGLKPRKPSRSLPSYKEPTPETNPKLSREEEAELALKRTEFTAGTPVLLVTLFLLTIVSVPFIQLVAELRTPALGLRMLDLFKTLPSATELSAIRGWRDLTNAVPSADELKGAEKALEGDSIVSQWLLPWAQSVLIGHLRAGNEQVYLGRDGWLFYRPDVDYITGPPFLDPARLKHRSHGAGIQPDPIKAIVQFRDQLAARGIELIVVPVPVKASIEADKLSGRAPKNEALQNSSFAEFKAQLAASGVRLFDPTDALMQQKTAPAYLQADTHWTPEAMELTAQELAKWSGESLAPPSGNSTLQVSLKEITGIGDIARMLKLPDDQRIYAPQTVTTKQVTAGNSFWKPSRDGDVLLLGDSFANIFSLEALGWGESAGFAEHLSVALGCPIDCILRNSDGAFATREMLANELARGRDRLAGKKLVIWEFAARELAFGNWKLLDLKLGIPKPSRFFTPNAGEEIDATGTVEVVSSVPRPGTVPYADHVMAVHLTQIARTTLREDMQKHLPPEEESLQALVYLSSMRDNVWTPAARLRTGDRITLRLRSWTEVASQLEQINRSEIADPEIQLEEPVWGELR